MDQNLDLRVQKTYSALTAAFFELLEEESLEKITVNALCHRALVRRPTFYKHFADKYAFVKYVIYTTQQELLQEIDTSTDIENPFDFLLTCFEKILDTMEQYQKALVHLQLDIENNFSFEMIDARVQPEIEKRIMAFGEQDAILSHDIDFTCQIILGMFRQISLWWFKQKDEMSKKEARNKMAQVLHLLFPTT
ncbi:Transcriptional regulator, TetR family [Weissella jogaejeotgali]|uniref:Transcriptional regulator, TetR family n=1 Tax=Weissella jogaejeotgali TaxID=1631871 RepID=A0A1L6R8R3_9LACO|nr:TetR/AcrR family transcriptional regulator [Weissella jogaejeotgali]APS40939.1 Transcriptional regulator, TetR family [Weissella jogaejeotgali]